MSDTKLPGWPGIRYAVEHHMSDEDYAFVQCQYWEARARLLYAAMGRYTHHDLACPMQIFNGSTHCNCDAYYATTALKACGPLPAKEGT